MSVNKRSITGLLQKYSIKPNKKSGQNFLINPIVASKIVGFASLSKNDVVLEIGGGLGAISKLLAELAGEVIIIEIDRRLVRALEDILRPFDNVRIVHANFLKVDLPNVSKIVSNLPYNLSSEITFRILKEMNFEQAILMYQKEFAERLVAEPCTQSYSRLTVNFTYLANAEILMNIQAKEFYPMPEVDSSIVRITKREKGPFASDDSVFETVVRGIFAYPNKQFRRALRIWFRQLNINKKMADRLIEYVSSIEPTDRIRCLGIDRLVELSDVILEMIEQGMIRDIRRNRNEVQ